jgi:hypothetical protein
VRHGRVADDALRERVVAHKRVFFPAAWAKMKRPWPGASGWCRMTIVLGRWRPTIALCEKCISVNRRPWPEVVARLRELEAVINRR